MKRAGGGFDYCYNAQTAMDDAAHIMRGGRTDPKRCGQPSVTGMFEAVWQTTGEDPRQVLADSGYRSEAVFEVLQGHPTDLVAASAISALTIASYFLPPLRFPVSLCRTDS